MNRIQKWGVGILVMFALGHPAYALKMGLFGILNRSDSHGATLSNVSVDYDIGTTLGFGGLLDVDLNSLFSIEFGVHYLPRKVSLAGTSTKLTMLTFPVVFRFTALPIVSFGVGAYYARGIGDIEVSSGGVSVDRTYAQVNSGENDFGFVLSVGGDIPVLPLFSIFVDGRLLWGIVDLATTSDTFSFLDFQILAGLKFGL